jgi:hypothetical protein
MTPKVKVGTILIEERPMMARILMLSQQFNPSLKPIKNR